MFGHKEMRSREGGWVAEWGGKERLNDTLTFEPETNESIMIKLFICLFTMEIEGFEGKWMGGWWGGVIKTLMNMSECIQGIQ